MTRPVWRQTVDSANGFPEGDLEFAETGLTPIPSVKVSAPRVKEAPIHFECKLHQILELGPKRQALVIGEVVYIHVDPACMTGDYIDMRKLDPVGRLNGFFYTTLGDILERKFDGGGGARARVAAAACYTAATRWRPGNAAMHRQTKVFWSSWWSVFSPAGCRKSCGLD